MWAIASSRDATTRTASTRSRYSHPLIAPHLDPGGGELCETAMKPLAGQRFVNQQRLGRVADAGALNLGVEHDAARHAGIRRGVDVNVAIAVAVDDVGDRCLVLDALDQFPAPTRHKQVDQPLRAHEL